MLIPVHVQELFVGGGEGHAPVVHQGSPMHSQHGYQGRGGHLDQNATNDKTSGQKNQAHSQA